MVTEAGQENIAKNIAGNEMKNVHIYGKSNQKETMGIQNTSWRNKQERLTGKIVCIEENELFSLALGTQTMKNYVKEVFPGGSWNDRETHDWFYL